VVSGGTAFGADGVTGVVTDPPDREDPAFLVTLALADGVGVGVDVGVGVRVGVGVSLGVGSGLVVAMGAPPLSRGLCSRAGTADAANATPPMTRMAATITATTTIRRRLLRVGAADATMALAGSGVASTGSGMRRRGESCLESACFSARSSCCGLVQFGPEFAGAAISG
jgi:hypothetical protein